MLEARRDHAWSSPMQGCFPDYSASLTKTTRPSPKPSRIGRSSARGVRCITSSSCGQIGRRARRGERLGVPGFTMPARVRRARCTELTVEGDRGFESCSLHRRVSCEPASCRRRIFVSGTTPSRRTLGNQGGLALCGGVGRRCAISSLSSSNLPKVLGRRGS